MKAEGISVLIPSGAGAPGFAGIAACLREESDLRLISGDVNENAYGKSLSDAFYAMPPSNSSDYINRVLEICELEKVQVVLPITTAELESLSAHRDVFVNKGVRLIISPEKGLKEANDKGILHGKAQKIGIAVPEGKVCENRNEFEEVAKDLLSRHARLFFKPVRGNGSRGIGLICRDVEPITAAHKPELMPLSLSEWMLRLPECFEVPLLLTEYLPGKEYSVDVFIWPGYDTLAIPRSRDKMVSGISVSGTFECNEILIEASKLLVTSLELEGPIGVQWRYNAEGIPHLLEINPRLQGTTSALRHAGLNVPLMAVKRALDRPVDLPDTFFWGRGFTRHWQDVFL
jgi:carbamoyl-phosphate synthase large subunit